MSNDLVRSDTKPLYSALIAFDDNKAKAFMALLRDIQRLGISGISFEVSTEKEIHINCQNESCDVLDFVVIKEKMLEKSQITEDVMFSVYDISEFVSLISIFSDGFGLSLNEEHVLIKKAPNSLRYYGCPHNVVRRPELKGEPEWLCEFVFNCAEMSAFIKALPIMPEGFVIITGDVGDTELKLSITDKDIKNTSFDTLIEVDELTSPIRLVFQKDYLTPVLKSHFEEFKVSIHKMMIKFAGSNDYFDQSFYVSSHA